MTAKYVGFGRSRIKIVHGKGVYSKVFKLGKLGVNLRCGPSCGVRLKSGTTGRVGEMRNRDRVKRKMAARSPISYTEVIHRQCCESSLATNLEASMRTGCLVGVVMDGRWRRDWCLVGVGWLFEVFAAGYR